MSRIITEELIHEAVRLAMPAIDAILCKEGTTWGPKLVAWCVKAPGLDEVIEGESFGEGAKWTTKNWTETWGLRGSIDLFEIAHKKLAVALREREATSVVAIVRSWCLEPGEFLWPGGIYSEGIAIAVSGAKGETDEAIAWIIFDTILLLAKLETRGRIEDKKMEI